MCIWTATRSNLDDGRSPLYFSAANGAKFENPQKQFWRWLTPIVSFSQEIISFPSNFGIGFWPSVKTYETAHGRPSIIFFVVNTFAYQFLHVALQICGFWNVDLKQFLQIQAHLWQSSKPYRSYGACRNSEVLTKITKTVLTISGFICYKIIQHHRY